jgi:hypothetical protein
MAATLKMAAHSRHAFVSLRRNRTKTESAWAASSGRKAITERTGRLNSSQLCAIEENDSGRDQNRADCGEQDEADLGRTSRSRFVVSFKRLRVFGRDYSAGDERWKFRAEPANGALIHGGLHARIESEPELKRRKISTTAQGFHRRKPSGGPTPSQLFSPPGPPTSCCHPCGHRAYTRAGRRYR